jgi:hypothetical protein
MNQTMALASLLTFSQENKIILNYTQDYLGLGDFERILSFDSILTLSGDLN